MVRVAQRGYGGSHPGLLLWGTQRGYGGDPKIDLRGMEQRQSDKQGKQLSFWEHGKNGGVHASCDVNQLRLVVSELWIIIEVWERYGSLCTSSRSSSYYYLPAVVNIQA